MVYTVYVFSPYVEGQKRDDILTEIKFRRLDIITPHMMVRSHVQKEMN
jgi:hypothetical protein